jgi:molybdopterin molybdotransferase
LIDYKNSQQILENINITKNESELVALEDANGRILANNVVAKENLPVHPTASMDGYAIKFDEQNINLKIISQTPAGTMPKKEVASETCIKTFTGSFMPKGADTLIPIENVTLQNNKIIINKKVPKNFAIRPIAETYNSGDTLLNYGTKIDFASIGVVASLGLDKLEVIKKPKVAVISTGSEIIEVGTPKQNRSQIYSSNNYTLQALLSSYGASVTRYPTLQDDKKLIQQTIQEAINQHDIVVTTGGVSVGDFDFVKDIIKEFGFEELFSKVAIKPGQHLKMLHKSGKFIFALPGFAYSATVTAFLYIVPTIKRMLGEKHNHILEQFELENHYTNTTNKTQFVAVEIQNGKASLNNKKQGSSAILTNLLGNTALMVVPPNTQIKPNDKVEVIAF